MWTAGFNISNVGLHKCFLARRRVSICCGFHGDFLSSVCVETDRTWPVFLCRCQRSRSALCTDSICLFPFRYPSPLSYINVYPFSLFVHTQSDSRWKFGVFLGSRKIESAHFSIQCKRHFRLFLCMCDGVSDYLACLSTV